MSELLHSELTEHILRCSFEVHGLLGTGFLEKVYENALVVELNKEGVLVEQQKPLKVHYKGQVVGEYCADLVIDNKVIVELKAVESLDHMPVCICRLHLRTSAIFERQPACLRYIACRQ